MAWKTSVTGMPLPVQLLEDGGPHDLDARVNPDAGENILALAELAVHKAFCRMSVPRWTSTSWKVAKISLAALSFPATATARRSELTR